ncbi:MAG: hypothetical protein LC745_01845 [Planctomycetia bacterium]|nr:hypothetical protein [Planctomycetia bacterium]
MAPAPQKLNSYDDVKALLNGFLSSAHVSIPGKHKVFWNDLSYTQFRDGDVPNVVDPTTLAPFKILVVGKPDESNLILALRGVGPVFDDDTGSVGRMPKNGPPWMPDDQIDALADWIARGCPDPSNPTHP